MRQKELLVLLLSLVHPLIAQKCVSSSCESCITNQCLWCKSSSSCTDWTTCDDGSEAVSSCTSGVSLELMVVIVISVLGVLFLIVDAILICIYCQRRRERKRQLQPPPQNRIPAKQRKREPNSSNSSNISMQTISNPKRASYPSQELTNLQAKKPLPPLPPNPIQETHYARFSGNSWVPQVESSSEDDDLPDVPEYEVNYVSIPPDKEEGMWEDSKDANAWWRLSPSEVLKEKEIAVGGYGVIYKGRYRELDVAVKVPKITSNSNLAQSQRKEVEEFQKEAMLMISLERHPNIVKLIGVCVEDGIPTAIVTEFCNLGSLKNLLDDPKVKVSTFQFLQIAEDIAKGVLHLHKERIFHRDLSARNILVMGQEGKWTCKVSDFGLSRLSKQDEGHTKTTTGPIRWMAPESLEQIYSAYSDVWSFGVTLWEVLARQDPYPEIDNVFMVASKLLQRQIRPSIPENCPGGIQPILDRCFAFDPKERPTFQEILEYIQGAKLEFEL